MLTAIIFAIASGYFIGSLQPAYILGKVIKNIDIRKGGSGNSGASNAVILLGWKFGVVVALIDIGKGFFSLFLIKSLFSDVLGDQLPFFLLFNGLFVILGHNHPFYMEFKGGKGTASLVGLLLALDYRIAIIGILAILVVTILTDYIALGTIALVLSFFFSAIYYKYDAGVVTITLLLACMSIYKHIPNIEKIRLGKETGLRKTFKKI
ncbi:glycerol-3-phosphate acyltransferase [Alkaliphilus serpentinus]|uniref:Glycerol-3-phosphate acyltransferase n=1 Tax=Alkaliphilus serpentinus TaxID=1482731 RepID=A0A833HPN7_9FIRM|nr:glycerol-3-phosphate acyltransferase [Alkaliphilus serpentinus]KAB3531110.1 glycerol-3-phosphate acyltransferase [Alkaliphilus serpentinus]